MKQVKEKYEEHFFRAVRMSVAKYNLLLTLLEEKLQKHSHRKPIDPDTRISLTLICLAHGISFQSLAWCYKMGFSTVRKIVYETCQAIWDELHWIYVAPPNNTDWMMIYQKFLAETGMPNCIGAIDGKHININCPNQSGSLYFNYKKHYSIVLMPACDASYSFTYMDVGAMGSQSDGGVFARSSFGKQILRNELNVTKSTTLPNSEINFPYYFVADNAFPLKPNIMRPYPGHNLTEDTKRFNEKLSGARCRIEIAFGIWRILQNTINATPENEDRIILATVVLHNFLLLQKDTKYYTTSEESLQTNLNSYGPASSNRSSAESFNLRDNLTHT